MERTGRRTQQIRKAGYRASVRKSQFFLKETNRLGLEIDENGINENRNKVAAILDLKASEKTRDLKSFLGDIQYRRTDNKREVLKRM